MQQDKAEKIFRKKTSQLSQNELEHPGKSKTIRSRSLSSLLKNLFSPPCCQSMEDTGSEPDSEPCEDPISSSPKLSLELYSPPTPGTLIRKIAFEDGPLNNNVHIAQIADGMTHIKFTGQLLSRILTTSELDGPDNREIHIKIIDPKKCSLKIRCHHKGQPVKLRKVMEETASSIAAIAINGGYYLCDYGNRRVPVGPLKTSTYDNSKGSGSEHSEPSYVEGNSGVFFRGHLTNLPTTYRNYYGVFAIYNNGLPTIASQKTADTFEKTFYKDKNYALSCGPILTKKGKRSFTEEELEKDKFIYDTLRKSHLSKYRSVVTPSGTLFHANENNPRSAIGLTRDGMVIMVTAKGRSPDHVGFTLPETSTLLHHLGAVDSLNLDGGASACQVYKDKSDDIFDSKAYNRCHNYISAISRSN